MYKTIFLLVRRPELSAQEFRKRWTDGHLRKVAKLRGLQRITGNLVIDDSHGLGLDAIGEFWWDSKEAFEAAVASKEGQQVIADIESIALSHEHVAVHEHRPRVRRLPAATANATLATAATAPPSPARRSR